jgi:phosphoenolpyruvate-protein kinase (PTS system EI component)
MVAPVLVGLGLVELSMSAVAIPEVKAMIRSMKVSDAEALVHKIQKLPTAAEIRATVSDYVLGLKARGA